MQVIGDWWLSRTSTALDRASWCTCGPYVQQHPLVQLPPRPSLPTVIFVPHTISSTPAGPVDRRPNHANDPTIQTTVCSRRLHPPVILPSTSDNKRSRCAASILRYNPSHTVSYPPVCPTARCCCNPRASAFVLLLLARNGGCLSARSQRNCAIQIVAQLRLRYRRSQFPGCCE